MAERRTGFTIEIKGTAEQQKKLGLLTGQLARVTIEHKKNTKAVKDSGGRNQELNKRLAQSKLRQQQLATSIRKTTKTINNFGQVHLKTGGLATSINKGLINSFKQLGATMLLAFTAREFIGGMASFSDALADTRKTTNLTADEVSKLSKELQKLNTRTSVTALLGIAEAAGRLNIAKDDILGFTEVVDKAVVALGDELSGSAEEIATDLGKISALLGLEEAFGAAEGINKIGSAINELGQTTKAQSQPIVDFSLRMAGIAPAANISAGDVLGLGAALDEFGQSSEKSATTVIRLIAEIGKDLPKFAGIAGKSIEDFSEILRKDGNEALLAVLKGAKSTEGGIAGLAETMGTLGIDATRSAQVITVLTENMDRLEEIQKISNDEIERGTSLTKEFNIKNETFAANIDKLKKEFQKLVQDTGVINFMSDLVKGIKTIIPLIFKLIKGLVPLAAGFVAYKTAIAATSVAIKIATIAQGAYSILTGILTGKIKLATIATRAFNIATKANPIGLIIGLLATAVTALLVFRDATKSAKEEQEKLNEAERENIRIKEEARELDAAEQKSIEDRISSLDKLGKKQVELLVSDINARIDKLKLVEKESESIIKQSEALKELDAVQKRIDERDVSLLSEFNVDTIEEVQESVNILRQNSEELDTFDIQANKRRSQEFEDFLKQAEVRLKVLKTAGDAEGELTKAQQTELDKRKAAAKKAAEDAKKELEAAEKELDKIRESLQKDFIDTEIARIQDEELQKLLVRKEAFDQEIFALEEQRDRLLEIQRITKEDLSFDLEELNNLELEKKALFEQDKLNIETEFADKRAKDTDKQNADLKKKDDKKTDDRIANLGATAAALGAVGALFKKGTTEQKFFASAQAVINTFLAASQTLADPALPFVAKIAGSIAIIASGLATVARINNVKFARGGVLDGPSHSQGGIPFTIDGRGGFEAEGGEVLLTKNVGNSPTGLRMASNLNQAFGGKRFFQGGGAFAPQNILPRAVGQVPELLSGSISREEAVELITEGVNAQQITVSETEISDVQARVEEINRD